MFLVFLEKKKNMQLNSSGKMHILGSASSESTGLQSVSFLLLFGAANLEGCLHILG